MDSDSPSPESTPWPELPVPNLEKAEGYLEYINSVLDHISELRAILSSWNENLAGGGDREMPSHLSTPLLVSLPRHGFPILAAEKMGWGSDDGDLQFIVRLNDSHEAVVLEIRHEISQRSKLTDALHSFKLAISLRAEWEKNYRNRVKPFQEMSIPELPVRREYISSTVDSSELVKSGGPVSALVYAAILNLIRDLIVCMLDSTELYIYSPVRRYYQGILQK